MAFSQSLQKGQSVVSCKLCMTDTKISWKCQECDVLMCNRCKETIHPNIKNAKNHTVLNLKEVALATEDVGTEQCKHKSRDCVMYCSSCELLVCPLCFSKIHNGHGLVEISKGLKIYTERLKEGQSQMKNHLDTLTKQGARIEEIKKSEKIKYMDARKKIQAHNKALKKQVDQYTEELMKELDQQWKTFTDNIEKEESHVTALKQTKKDSNQEVEKIINSNDLGKMVEADKKFENSLKEKLYVPEIKFNLMQTFIPGDILPYHVGALQESSTSDISINIRKEFTTDLSRVYFLSPSNKDDCLWISNHEIVQNVKVEEGMLKVLSSHNMTIWDMAVMPSNNVLLTTLESVLKQVNSSTGEITNSVYNVDPLEITAVHVTSDFKVIVGATGPGEPFPASGNRVVIVMDKSGKNKQRYELDYYNNRLYTYPRKITTTANGNICVMDHLSADNTGRIVVRGMDGRVINIYSGVPDINTKDNPFKPMSITTTPSDNLIIPELNTYILHILNNNGQQITYIKGGDVGIYYPFSVAFTTHGKSYIGCTTAKGIAKDAKLYEVGLVGF